MKMANMELADGRSCIGNLTAVSKLLRDLDGGTVVTVTVYDTSRKHADWTARPDAPGQLRITDVDGVDGAAAFSEGALEDASRRTIDNPEPAS